MCVFACARHRPEAFFSADFSKSHEPFSLFHHSVLFFCDDALHKLGNIHANKTFLCFNNNIIYGDDLAPVNCI